MALAGLRPVRLAVGLALLWPAGCGALRPATRPVEPLEPAIRERITQPEPAKPEPAAEAATLTPTEVVAIALRQNPRLAAARAAVERAGAGIEEAASPLLPRLNVLNRYIVTSANQGAGAPGLTGAVLSERFTGTNA